MQNEFLYDEFRLEDAEDEEETGGELSDDEEETEGEDAEDEEEI
jgi:hypothetical protein